MNSDIEQAKALMLREHAAKLQTEKGLSFALAWQRALEAHPELQEIHQGEDLQPTDRPAFATSSGYRYTEDRKHFPTSGGGKSHVDALRTILKDAGVWPAVQRIAAREKLDPQTAELLYGGPVKVEATPEKENGRPSKKGAMLVYGGGIPLF